MRARFLRLLPALCTLALLASACGTDEGGSTSADAVASIDSAAQTDGVALDSGTADTGVVDAGQADTDTPDADPVDAGPADAGPVDAGPVDVGAADSGAVDTQAADTAPADTTSAPDAGPSDAGPPDAGPPDAGTPDAGTPDAGTPDAGPSDAGTPDAGTPDAGTPDAGAPPSCGDGAKNQLSEQCDDGGTLAGDGCSATCTLELTPTTACTARHTALFNGVTSLNSGGGLPGRLVVHGTKSCAHLVDTSDRVIIASAELGQGRIVSMGHNSFISDSVLTGGNLAFAKQAIAWLAKGKAGATVGLVGNATKLKNALIAQGFKVKAVSASSPGAIDVLITTAGSTWNTATVTALTSFVQQGGGMLIGGQAWWWSSQNPGGSVATGFKANLVTNPAGITVSADTATQGKLVVSAQAPPPWTNARVALGLAALHANKQAVLPLATRKAIASHAGAAVRVLPLGFTSFFATAQAFRSHYGELVPTVAKPVVAATQPLWVLALRVDEKLHLTLPANKLTAHPAAKNFPGAVPDGAKTITKQLTINGTHAGLHKDFAYSGAKALARRSTGLYAAPGAVLTVSLNAAHIKAGLRLLVGAHSDQLWSKDKIQRHPNLTRAWSLTSASTQVGSVFGGPVYVQVPVGAKLGPISITIAGAVAAPRYEVGKTTLAEWLVSRDAPGPWAELVGKNIAFTMPSSHVRKLADPADVLAFWDGVLDQSAALAAIPTQRPRRERVTADRQISAGYMHSGYPIMTHLDSPAGLLNLTKIKAEGSWGLFHEIGHNHQWRPSVIAKATEVTVNLWSTHTCEQVTTKKVGCHPNTVPAKAKQIVASFIAKGAKSANWDAWTGLQMYLQLKDGFGWQTYKKVWQSYYKLSGNAVPTNDAARADTWCVLMSQASGKQLGWFLKHWSVGVSTKGCLDVVAGMDPWLQDPMRVYFPYPAAVTALPAMNVAGGTANARFQVGDPGGKGASLSVFYGTTDGGTKATAWAKELAVGPTQAGVGSAKLTGLQAGTKVVYRVRVLNSLGAYWSKTAVAFTAK